MESTYVGTECKAHTFMHISVDLTHIKSQQGIFIETLN